MKKWIISIIFGMSLMPNNAVVAEKVSSSDNELISDHMVAQAMLTAYFVDAALKAGMSQEEINVVFKKIAEESAISEFWVSDENGNVEFTNFPDVNFSFPTDPSGTSQAAPFAALISGEKNVVVQAFSERELDNKIYKYVGVSGIDKSRIVQVGVSASEME